jgi:hypothetical protein
MYCNSHRLSVQKEILFLEQRCLKMVENENRTLREHLLYKESRHRTRHCVLLELGGMTFHSKLKA